MNTQDTDSKKISDLKHNKSYIGPTNREKKSFQKNWDTFISFDPNFENFI